ncbi:MAG: FliH/SctL family protein [Chloroflexota bacterium]
MKSSLRSVIHTEQSSHQAWVPEDLNSEPQIVPMDEKMEQIAALFGAKFAGIAPKTERRQVVHSALFDTNFNNWNPADINDEPEQLVKEEWSFIATEDLGYKIFKPEPVKEEPRIVEPEHKNAAKTEKLNEEILKQARAQAEEIILEAQKMADQMMSIAQEEIEQQKQAGHKQGMEAGYQEVDSTIMLSRLMVEEVDAWKKDLLSQSENIVLGMVKDIAQTMFGEGVKLDPTALQQNLNRVMESAQGLGDLNIFINPRDARLLDPSWSEYQLLITGDRVKIIPSETITPGGCFVKGSMGTVDARVETQLSAVIKSLDENEDSTD